MAAVKRLSSRSSLAAWSATISAGIALNSFFYPGLDLRGGGTA